MATSQQKTALRAQRKAAGLCIHCGKTAQTEKTMCEVCAEKNRANLRKAATRRQEQGFCRNAGCGKQPAAGNKYCDNCNASSAARTSRRRQSWIAQGNCASCNKAPCAAGLTRCLPCNEQIRQCGKRLRDKRITEGKCSTCGLNVLVTGYKKCEACIADGCARHAKRKLQVVEAYGGCKCVGCGETEIEVLQIDHIDGGGNVHAIAIGKGTSRAAQIASGRGKMYSWLIQNNFPPGYRVLCANCNIRAARKKPFPVDRPLSKKEESHEFPRTSPGRASDAGVQPGVL